MSRLIPTHNQTAGESAPVPVLLGEHGAAVFRDGSITALKASSDLNDALDNAAAVITKERKPDDEISATVAPRHFLLAASDSSVLHNGDPVTATGIAALGRKDEILVACETGVQRLYYSDEVIPEPEAIPDGLNEDSCCPRCSRSLLEKSPTAEGLEENDDPTISRKPLIRCGGCGTLYHAHGCHAYEPTCLICLAPTTGHKLWSPEELE